MAIEIDPEKLQRELDSMREMIDSDPDVRNHFDTNGDGQIDGSEWEAVRQMVVRRLENEAQEVARARSAMQRDVEVAAAAAPPAAPLAERVFVEEVLPHLVENEATGPMASMIEHSTLLLQQAQDTDRPERVVRNHLREEVGRVIFSKPKQGGAVKIDVRDGLAGSELELHRSGSGEPLLVLVDRKEVARTTWQVADGQRFFEISGPSGSATARHPRGNDLLYDVELADGTPVARLQDNWTGPGIWLSDGNVVRISMGDQLANDLRWALLATAVLVDLQRSMQHRINVAPTYSEEDDDTYGEIALEVGGALLDFLLDDDDYY